MAETAAASALKVTVLGSGSSGGIPMVAEGWGACDPAEPRNRRLRASILIEQGETTILVDTSPDLRQQLLTTGTQRIDALVYTHAHADHLHGIDDIRALNKAMNAPIPAYADAKTRDQIAERFGYALRPLPEGRAFYFKPTLEMHVIAPGDAFDIGGVPIRVFDQDHGHSRTLGYRFGDFAYSTDLIDLPEAGFEALDGVDTWYVGVFTDTPHDTHVHVEKALAWVERVRPRRAVFGHLGPRLCYRALSAMLPDGIDAAYDGMTFEVPTAAARGASDAA